MTSVDNSPGHGVDAKLAPKMKSLHDKIDGLIKKMETTKDETVAFKEEFFAELDKKKKFYDEHERAKSDEFRKNKEKQKMGDMENSSFDDAPGSRGEKLKLDN